MYGYDGVCTAMMVYQILGMKFSLVKNSVLVFDNFSFQLIVTCINK